MPLPDSATPPPRPPAPLSMAPWRTWLAVVGAVACLLCAGLATAQPYSEWVHYRRLDLETPWGPQRVLVTLPRLGGHREHPPGERYPLVVALHGRGEAQQGPERGYLGWATRYGLPDHFGAMMRGRLYASDYRGYVRQAHLDAVNESLRAQPFRGVMVVTPYIPDVGRDGVGSARIREIGDWIAGPLLASVRERFDGAARTREGTAIDGISLGGRVALTVGFAHPEVFGAVGGMQPAIRGDEEALAARALEAAAASPQRIRLLSSEEDPFLRATRTLSEQLRERRVPHRLTVVPGPHDYSFNRGPAGLEMLYFYDRALAREPLPE
ncbi:MAG: alpha/beta hydrolase-fold protein [Sandaracinaceae bacterium]